MDGTNLFVALLGSAAGLLLWSRLVRLAIAIYDSAKSVDFAAQLRGASNRQGVKFLLLLFACSLVWATLFGGLSTRFATGIWSPYGWSWFFGGMGVAPVVIVIASFVVLRRRGKLERAQP